MSLSQDGRKDPRDTVVLVDFDGTITEEDVGIVLLRQYSTTDWEAIEARFAAGEVGIVQNMQEQFSYVPHDAPTLIEHARSVTRIRSGWEDLVCCCRQRGVEIAIVSGGLDFYVQALLPPSDPPLEVHCLRAEYAPEGWRVSPPPNKMSGPEPSEFKQAVVATYRQTYQHVWFIGNGVSDHGAAEVADKVWAVEPLLSYCREHGIEATSFETFHDVWKDMDVLLHSDA